MSPVSSTWDQLAARILAHRYACGSEQELADGLEQVIRGAEVAYEREARLGPMDRVDFLANVEMVTGRPNRLLAIEVKIKSGYNEVLRQLHRYAQHEAVCEVWLVTTRAQHRGMPPTLGNKPVRVLYLAGSVLG